MKRRSSVDGTLEPIKMDLAWDAWLLTNGLDPKAHLGVQSGEPVGLHIARHLKLAHFDPGMHPPSCLTAPDTSSPTAPSAIFFLERVQEGAR